MACNQAEPFQTVPLAAMSQQGSLLDQAAANTAGARSLLSDAANLGGGDGASGGGGLGLGDKGKRLGVVSTSALSANVETGTPETNVAGGMMAGSGGGGGSGSSGSGFGRGGGGDASAIAAAASAGKNDYTQAEKEARANRRPTREEGVPLDPDNSENWTEAEMAERLKAALGMDADEYFRLIPSDETLFARVHKRYRKLDRRVPGLSIDPKSSVPVRPKSAASKPPRASR